MNFELPHIPSRESHPRETGLTMMMDKGLSWRETENFIDASAHLTDLVKFGFGTSYVTKDLEKKLSLYKEAGIKTYFGGTLFEAFIARGMFDDYRKLMDKYKMETAKFLMDPSNYLQKKSVNTSQLLLKILQYCRKLALKKKVFLLVPLNGFL